MKALLDELFARGLVAQVSDKNLGELLQRQKVTMYVGFDPTASSLHLGHLLPIMGMAHFQRAGHKVIALVGGATGMVGDPSGKSDERNLLSREAVAENVVQIKSQLSKFLEFEGENAALMLDNNDWIGPMSFVDWLRDVGKYFRVNQMLAKESVKKRLDSEEGISFTEFSYMTMQAYDYLYLFDNHGCTLQSGGNDQWGNIIAGMELIQKVRGADAFALTFPLITTASGEKFGKSAGNAVWLDPERTSPYQFYQYWVQRDDRDVENYLKYFTFRSTDEIDAICADHAAHPEKREAQKILAADMTALVHGDDALTRARRATDVLFGAEIRELSDSELFEIFADVPSVEMGGTRIDAGGMLPDFLVEAGIFASKSEVRRMIKNGGLYINNRRVENAEENLSRGLLASETTMVVRKGRRDYTLVRFV